MIEEPNKENGIFYLTPFIMENPFESDMCEVSLEHQDGWKAIPILIDSGASDSVAPAGTFPDIPMFETNASKNNLFYTARRGACNKTRRYVQTYN